MNKHLKYTLAGLGALLGLFLVALIVVALTFDPNQYKDMLAAKVRDATGRELVIHGDLELAVFPVVVVRTGSIELGNRAGFGPAPFARVDGLDVRIALWPLLFKRVEIGTVDLRGLRIDLARAADGSDNWSDLAGDYAAPAATSETASEPLNIEVAGVRVVDAALTFTDAQASRQYRIEKLAVTTRGVRPGAPIEVEASLEAHATNPTLDATLDFAGTVVLPEDGAPLELRGVTGNAQASGSLLPIAVPDARYAWQRVALGADRLTLEGLAASALGASLTLDAELEGLSAAGTLSGRLSVPAFTPAPELLALLARRLPEGADAAALAPLAFESRFKLGLGSQELEVSELRAQALGLHLEGRVSGLQVLDAPQLAGHLTLAEFAPRRVMQALGVKPPVTADQGVLGRADLDAQFSLGPNAARLERFTLGLDGANLTGSLTVDDIAKRALRFDLTVDSLDLDRYLPPKVADAAAQAQEGALDAIVLPAQLVRTLDVAGRLRAGELRLSGIKATELDVGITAREAQLKVAPIAARLYSGTVKGEMGLDARRGEPSARVRLGLAGVQLAPLLRDGFQSDLIAGAARLDIDLGGTGRTVGEVRRTLGGRLAFALDDGAIVGFDLWHSIRTGWATIKGHAAPAPVAGPRTPFERLSGTAQVAEGVLDNRDLVAAIPFLEVRGAGKVDLVAEAVDYKVRAAVVGTPNFGPGEELSGLTGLSFPATISGKFSALRVRPDLGAAVRGAVKQKAAEQVEDRKEEVKDKLKQKLSDLLKR